MTKLKGFGSGGNFFLDDRALLKKLPLFRWPWQAFIMPSQTISGIGQIAINVQDLKRATEFYRETLGLRHLFSAGTMEFFDCGGVRLMLAVPETAELKHPSSILYYKVGQIEEFASALAGKGVSFDRTPFMVAKMPNHELWMAFFRDSENNLLALMCERPLN